MKPKAILLGLVTWFNIWLVFGGASFLLMRSLSPDQRETFVNPATVLVFGFAVGAVISFLAGYVAGRVARREALTHAAVVGAIIAAVGFILPVVLIRNHHYPVGHWLVRAVFQFAFAVFGGWFANWRNEKAVTGNPVQNSEVRQ